MLGRVEVGDCRLQRSACHPRRFRVRPPAEVQPKDVVQLGRDIARLLDNASEIFLGDRDVQQRVRLDPARRIADRIVVHVERANVAERSVVDDLAEVVGVIVLRIAVTGRNPDSVLVFGPTRRLAIGTAIRNHQQERLATELEPAFQHLDDAAIRVLVQLVHEREVRSRTGTRLFRLPRHRPEKRALGQVRNIELAALASAELQIAIKLGRLAHHLDSIAEQDRRLLFRCAGRVNLGARLSVRNQPIEPDAARQGRLAVTLALLDVGPPEPPRLVRSHPPEQRTDYEHLRRMQQKRPILELTLAQPKPGLEEPERPSRRLGIEPQITPLEVIQMPPARVPDMGPSYDRPGDNRLGICSRPVSQRIRPASSASRRHGSARP